MGRTTINMKQNTNNTDNKTTYITINKDQAIAFTNNWMRNMWGNINTLPTDEQNKLLEKRGLVYSLIDDMFSQKIP